MSSGESPSLEKRALLNSTPLTGADYGYQAEERLRLALELGRLSTWEWKFQDNQIVWGGYPKLSVKSNPGGLGFTFKEAIARILPADQDSVHHEISRSLASGEDFHVEFRVIWPDSSVHWIEARARLQLDSQGEAMAMAGIAQDITARKCVEESHPRFEAVFEAAQDAVLIADDERRYVAANPAAGELFGLPKELLVGRQIEEFVDQVRGREVQEAWQHFQEAGVQRGECRLRRADGSYRELEYSAKTSFAPGLHLSILRDVTERKRSEELLARHASELRASNADLQRFAYLASHDLQEPLRTISSYAKLLDRRHRDKLEPEATEFLAFILDGAERMERLIRDLLSYSSVIKSECSPLQPVPVETSLQWARMNLQTAIEASGATITHDTLPTVTGEPMLLAQVIQNLLSNAIKYRREQEPPRIHISAQEQAGNWVISIRDHGPGIATEYQEKVFDLFRRLHGREISGTGIGLATCKSIVERLDGRIWVESEGEGKGSTFRFSLPAAD